MTQGVDKWMPTEPSLELVFEAGLPFLVLKMVSRSDGHRVGVVAR